ncbi:hypothetical protein R5R35_005725 [Gryllus longicercus]|uniref:L-Fucosyltransferase n=1 Tax=Gryllus longicercus TaxID=2509291 RepID=A0AAN9W7L1_9ORTH
MTNLRNRVKYFMGLLVALIASILFLLNSEILSTFLAHRNADNETFSKINDNARTHVKVKMKDGDNFTCLARLVFVQNGGRLGNKLMEYANVWSLAKLNGLTPIVADAIYNEISPLFTKLSVTPLSRFLSELYEKDPMCGQVAEKIFLREEIIQKLSTLGNVNEMKSKGPIIIKRYSVLAETIYRTRNSLKQEFIYNGKLKSYAWQTLWKAASSLNNTALPSKVIYIGVHVRRTDYLKYLKKKLERQML